MYLPVMTHVYCFSLQTVGVHELETYKNEVLSIYDKNDDGKLSRDELGLLLSVDKWSQASCSDLFSSFSFAQQWELNRSSMRASHIFCTGLTFYSQSGLARTQLRHCFSFKVRDVISRCNAAALREWNVYDLRPFFAYLRHLKYGQSQADIVTSTYILDFVSSQNGSHILKHRPIYMNWLLHKRWRCTRILKWTLYSRRPDLDVYIWLPRTGGMIDITL